MTLKLFPSDGVSGKMIRKIRNLILLMTQKKYEFIWID